MAGGVMTAAHDFTNQLDAWGCKVYCACGLVFAVPYPADAYGQETSQQRRAVLDQARDRWSTHRDEATA
jgi:hypothetical protein